MHIDIFSFFPAPSDEFRNALDIAKDEDNFEEVKRIINTKFKDQIFGIDKDAAKFVDLVLRQSLEIKTKIYKLAPLNFFYQQDPNKQTTFHNIAASEKKCDNLLKVLFQGLTDKEEEKLWKILTKTNNGKSKNPPKINPDTQLEEFAKRQKNTLPNYSYHNLEEEEIQNAQNPDQKTKITVYCECICEFKNEPFKGVGTKKNEARQNAAEKALLKHKLSYNDRSADSEASTTGSTKQSQTPLDVAIAFENFEFISKCQMF